MSTDPSLTDPSPVTPPPAAAGAAAVHVRARTVLVADGAHAIDRFVVVANDGPGSARHLGVRLVPSPGPGAALRLDGVGTVDRLPARGELALRLTSPAPRRAAEHAVEVAVVWSDGVGRHELVRRLTYAGA